MTLIWLTGLSGSGKTTIAEELHKHLPSKMLDGDLVRETYTKELKPGPEGREENLNKVIELATNLLKENHYVIGTFVSPESSLRNRVRREIESSGYRFIEVYVKTSLETCKERDVKGLYKRLEEGEEIHLAGITEEYEEPSRPEVICRTEGHSPRENAFQILNYLRIRDIASGG